MSCFVRAPDIGGFVLDPQEVGRKPSRSGKARLAAERSQLETLSSDGRDFLVEAIYQSDEIGVGPAPADGPAIRVEEPSIPDERIRGVPLSPGHGCAR